MFPGLEYVVAGLAVVVIAGSLALFMPLLKRDRLARFCSSAPHWRRSPLAAHSRRSAAAVDRHRGHGVTAQFFDMFSGGLRDGSVRTFAGAGAAAIVSFTSS